MLMKKLKVDNWNVHTPFVEVDYEPSEVKLKLKQAVGEPSIPTVSFRDKVSKGDVIAKIPDGKFGSTIHASISGVVVDVNNDFIRIIKN
jgi:Na+-translocating ferredoxin:NAD+ oxidoreductase RnfC subunit